MNKSVVILISTLGIVAITALVFSIRSLQNSNITNNKNYLIPTPITSNVFAPSVIPTQNIVQAQQNDKLINAVEHRSSIASSDTQAKQLLINSLPENTEIIYSTNLFRVFYIPTPDVFQVEIDDQNYQEAKKSAVDWFISKGFTQDGICKLPVVFYLNFDIKQQLPDRGANFTPLAQGC